MLKLKLLVPFIGLAMIPSAVLPAQAPVAPLPAQILTAKKVFISNAVSEIDLKTWSGGSAQPYNEFYAAIQSWGHYEIVATPGNADLILRLGYFNPITGVIDHSLCVNNCAVYSPQIRLELLDPKTSIDLWTIAEKLPAVDKNHRSADANLVVAIGSLVSDLKVLTAQPAVSAK